MYSDTLYLTAASAGTGKTYTLAAHYIALLMNGFSHKQILAVTFTNKATAEMKERIITYLHAIAVRPDLPDVRAFLSKVREVSNLRHLKSYSDAEYATRAQTLVAAILSDYDDMRITTIDSFLQTLLTGLAHTLGQAAGYSVDLDLDHAITQAVDEVLSLEVSENADIRDAVVGCLSERLGNEEKWDLRPTLIDMARELYKESVQIVGDEILFTSADHPEHTVLLRNYKEHLAAWRKSERMERLRAAYNRIAPLADSLASDTGGKNYSAFFRRLTALTGGQGTDFKPLGNTDFNRFVKPAAFKCITPADCSLLQQQVSIINDLLPEIAADYAAFSVRGRYLSDLQLVGFVIDRIRRNLREQNTILLAETANTLFRALRDHDAQFILMKAGIRYKHIMLDEFQDTSTLQWANFRPLIEEILSQDGGTALIVGDIKQSIYRWRNGDFEIMRGLSSPIEEPILQLHLHDCRLVRNFRSRREIVGFCMRTFHDLADKEGVDVQQIYDEGFSPEVDLQSFYSPSNQDGYVSLRGYQPAEGEHTADVRDRLLSEMFARMESLLEAGYRPSDMLILVRSKTEAARVLEAFNDCLSALSETGERLYPALCRAGKIVSGDSFRLSTSIAVSSIISALKYIILADPVALEYLRLNCPEADLSKLRSLNRFVPLTDLFEQVVRICLCASGAYEGTDIAHLNCLRDKLRAYIGRYGSDPEAFLRYWDDSMFNQAIPAAESDDIRIMTIHASKGLQAKNVFIPFVSWGLTESPSNASILWCRTPDFSATASVQHITPSPFEGEGRGEGLALRLPIRFGKDMEDAGYKDDYERELQKQRIDALNLLYVACTRAEDNLFLSILLTSRTKDSAGCLLYNLYGSDREWGTLQLPEQKAEKQGMPKPFDFTRAEALYALSPDDTSRPRLRYVSADSESSIEFRQSQQSRQLLLTPQDIAPAAAPVSCSQSKTESLVSGSSPAGAPSASIDNTPAPFEGEGRGEGLPSPQDSDSVNIEFGNLCHAILEHVRTAADLPSVVMEFYLRGQIPSSAMRDRILRLLERLMQHPIAGEWFGEGWQILREDTVLQLRPAGEASRVVERRMDRVMIRGNEAVVLDYKFGNLHPEYFEQVREYMLLMQQMGYAPVRGYLWAGFHNRLTEVTLR